MTRRGLFTSALLIAFAVPSDAQNPPGNVAHAGAPTEASAMFVPLSTTSAGAKMHFLLGLRDFDVGAPTQNARRHFDQAIAADPAFAMAHYYRALAGASLAEYRTHLDHAVERADKASTAEQLMIRIERRGFDGDVNGQLELAQQLVQAAPNNPRALQTLATAQNALGRVAESRATLEQAVKAAPRFPDTHIQLGNSLITTEPRDIDKGITHIRHAVEIAPNEPYTHDFLGDAYRAKNDLASARASYTRMAELAPSRPSAYQQRGHVHSFLGDFAAARADYDRSIELGTPSEKASYAVYRAFASVHANDPAAAEKELEELLGKIDGWNPPDLTGAKIFVLQSQFFIATHHRHVAVAERAQSRLRTLRMQFADEGNTERVRQSERANIAFDEGILAAVKGEYDAARAKAREYMQLREGEKNPRRNENAHFLLGYADLLQGNHAAAAAHLAQSNPNDAYAVYQHAVALEGAGRTAEARQLFQRVGSNNFNGLGVALIKRDAIKRGG